MTNYEKIKAMGGIWEMAKFLDSIIHDCKHCLCNKTCHLEYGDCVSNLAKWLESEAKDNG